MKNEYVAACNVIVEMFWIWKLLKELFISVKFAIIVVKDDLNTIGFYTVKSYLNFIKEKMESGMFKSKA